MRKLMVAGCLILTGATAPAPRWLPESSEPSALPFRADHPTAAGYSEFVVMSDLPLPAQARIATVLGRDDVEYHAVRRGAGVAVRNASHRLAVDFTKNGIEVRTETATWRSALRGYGHGQHLRVAAPVMPLAHENRVEYNRGDLTEWYVNGPLGLEQGFTIPQPVGDRRGAPLAITLSVSGTLSASVDAAGTSMTLSTPDGGHVLRYRGLTAYDAAGRELRAWMEVEADQLTLRVDDLHAQYPVVVDPFIEQATLTASDGAVIDQFGISVAIDGDALVVGTLRGDGVTTNTGAAYVFEKPASGWTGNLVETAKLIASDGTLNASFGSFVAIDGETIAVGTSIGAAYVFVRPAGGWSGLRTQDARLTPSECCNNPFTVAISGDTVVSGSPNKDFPGSFEQGAAYVFVKPAAGWTNMTETARLTASDGAGGDFFGTSIAMSGDTIVVGSPQDEPTAGGAADFGSAYLFVKPAAGWGGSLQEVAKLTASDAAFGDIFGFAVAISGPTVVVGAPRKGGLDQGGAYVFEMPSGGWSGALTENARLIASDGGGNFGLSVAVSGNTVVTGAPLNANSRGAAYVFLEPAGGWNGLRAETQKLVTSNPFWVFRMSVAISGATIVVGQFNNLDVVGDKGSAYVFEGTAADVEVTMSASPNPVVVGSDVTYTITVTNNGPDDAPSVTITDDLANELTFASCAATGSGTCAGSGNARSVTFASLAADASETISIVAVVNAAPADGNTIVNTASAASAATDHNSENDSATTSISVIQQADLIVTKAASAGPVEAGTQVSYTITLINNGPNSAAAVTLTDSLAAGTTFVSHSPANGWTCVDPPVGAGGTITCSVASMPSGAMATFTVVANLSCSVVHGVMIANTASVSSSTPDPTVANNSATATVTASNAPPVVSTAVASTVLSSMNEPQLVNVGLSASLNDGACAAPTMTVNVFGDEDDQTPIARNDVFSPDAADVGIGTLRLRAERVKNLDGRVYLIVVRAVDAAGAAGFATTTVVVPQKPSPSSLSSVNAQAAAAKSYADAHGGTPPPGFFVIGEGPIIGPLQ